MSILNNKNNLFKKVIYNFLDKILEYIHENIIFKLFMVKNPNSFTNRYWSTYELEKFLNFRLEKDIHKKKYPFKENVYRISIKGSGRIGCKLKFIYIRHTDKIKNKLLKYSLISKNFYNVIKIISKNKIIKNIKLNENMKFKLFMKEIYDTFPNFYKEYCKCNYNIPKNTYQHYNRKCLCYDKYTCDLCTLDGKLKSDLYYGNMYMCYYCNKELYEDRLERWEDKHCCNDY